MNQSGTIKIIIGAAIFSFLIYLYVVELYYFSNTVDVIGLIGKGALIIMPIGALIIYKIIKTNRSMTLQEKFMTIIAGLILCLVFTPLLSSLFNRITADDQRIIEARLIEMQVFSPQPMGLIDTSSIHLDQKVKLIVDYEGNLTSFNIADMQGIELVDSIVYLPMHRSRFNHDYLSRDR